MGYNKQNFKRIREEYSTKCFRAQQIAQERREELYTEIPELRRLDGRLSEFGLRVMQAAIRQEGAREELAALRRENERILAERAELLRRNGFPADYSEVQYECNECRDTGYVGIKMCSCMHRALIEAGIASSGLAGLMRTQSFENFSLDYYLSRPKDHQIMSRNYQNLYRYAHNFSILQGEPSPSSLLFFGGTGLGKTHLSTAIARVVIERGYDVYYNSAVGMISAFEQRRFGNGLAATEGDGDDTARYTECDLLIVDDLGTEVVNQFTLSCLYHVVNTRLNLQKPTVISTNLGTEELRKLYGDRMASRWLTEYQVVPFYGTDVRMQKISLSQKG